MLTEALSPRFAVQVKVADYDLAHALKIDTRAFRTAQDLATRQAKAKSAGRPNCAN